MTLLHILLLVRHPELVLSGFPTLCFKKCPSVKDSEPEYDEIKRAFTSLLPKAHFLKLAALVDGLDKFKGDQVIWPYSYEVNCQSE